MMSSVCFLASFWHLIMQSFFVYKCICLSIVPQSLFNCLTNLTANLLKFDSKLQPLETQSSNLFTIELFIFTQLALVFSSPQTVICIQRVLGMWVNIQFVAASQKILA